MGARWTWGAKVRWARPVTTVKPVSYTHLCVLGTTLEMASNQLLDSYAQGRFFEPLGMEASFCSGNFPAEELATLYTPQGVGRSAASCAAQPVPDEIGKGASFYPGGLTISAREMAKLVCVCLLYTSASSLPSMDALALLLPSALALIPRCVLGLGQHYHHSGQG